MTIIGNGLSGVNDRVISNQIWKGILITGFPGGSLNSARAVLQSATGSVDGTWRMAVLNASTGAVLASSATRTDVGAFGTYTFTFGSESISAGDIILVVGVDGQTGGSGFVFYSDTDTYDGRTSDNFYAVSPPPSTIGTLDDSGRDYSMDLDYSAAGVPGNASGALASVSSVTPSGSASSSRSVTVRLVTSLLEPLDTVSRRFWTRATLDGAAVDGGAGGLSVTCNNDGVFVLTGLNVGAGAGWLTYKDPADDMNCHSVPVTYV